MTSPAGVVPELTTAERTEACRTRWAGVWFATLRLVVMALDGALVALAFLLGTALFGTDRVDVDSLPLRLPLVAALMVTGLWFGDGYELEKTRNGYQVLSRTVLGSAVGLGLVSLASAGLADLGVSRAPFALFGALSMTFLLAFRRSLFGLLRERSLRPRALVLGEPAVAQRVAAALDGAWFCGTEVVGILCPGRPSAPRGALPCLGGYERLVELAERHGISQAVVVAGARDEAVPIEDIVALRRRGLTIEDGSAAYEAVTGKLLIERLTPGWLAFANAFEPSKLELALRRVLGFAVAGAALLALSPFLALTALAIRLDSRGPVLFRQVRVGERGRRFELLKFRTMREDAEKATGPVWASARDPRVTRIGRVLRRTRIDELPQLLNVLLGDMYFVGPRPERPHFVELLEREVPHYAQRHVVKPGITGWAQINYRYGSSVKDAEEKLHYDLFYIRNMSTLLDLYIVLGTIRVMLAASNES